MCLWANYIFPRWVCLFCWRKYVDRFWEYINRSQTHECGNWGWGRAIPRKGIFKRNCHCSANKNNKSSYNRKENNGLKDISEDIIIKLNEPFFYQCVVIPFATFPISWPGSLTRDFRLQAFSTNQFPPGLWVWVLTKITLCVIASNDKTGNNYLPV